MLEARGLAEGEGFIKYVRRAENSRPCPNHHFPIMSRFHIHAITLENFKSYAGCIRLQDISPGFVSIVGPNGSGKSNLLEALLFVLGRKVHHLRLNSSSDLIYRGAGPRANHALVQVEFLRDSEVITLERKVLWNNSSIYRVNGTEMSLREVRSRLKSIGIDLDHEHFAVLQGQVELLSTMKERSGYPDDPSKHAPEGLLEYFEGLIGTRSYHYLLVAVQNELESMLEALPAALEGVRDTKARKKELKEAAKECGLRLKRELDWYKVGNVTLQLQFQAQSATLAAAIQAESDLSTQLSQLEAQLHSLRSTHSLNLARLHAAGAELESGQIARLTVLGEMQECYLPSLEEKLRTAEEKLAAKKELLTQTIQAKTDLEAQVVTLTPALSHSEISISALTSDIREMQTALLEMDSKNGSLREIRLRLETANRERRESEQTLEIARKEYESHLEVKNNAEKQRKASETDRKSLFAGKERLEKTLKSTETLLEEGRSRLTVLHSSLTATRLQRGVTAKLVATLQEDITRSEQMHKHIERSKSRTEKAHQLHQALRPVLDSGRFPDILGRMGDLASVPREFDIVLSTLYAGPLNSYVALRVDAATQLLKYCSDMRLGKVTVYVVEAIGENGWNRRFTPPEVTAVRLFDQLQIDPFKPDLKKVFYQVMRDTMVVSTLAEATNLAFHYSPRPTVVTKAGDIVRSSGEMQGHAAPLQGLIRISTEGNPNCVPSLPDTSVSDLKYRLQAQNQLLRDLEAQLQACSVQISAVSAQETDSKAHISQIRTEISLLEAELRKPVESSALYQNRILALNSDLENLKIDLERAKSMVESSTEACEALQIQLESLRSPASKRLSDHLCRAKVQLERSEAEYNGSFQQLSSAKAKIEAGNNSVYRLLAEISAVEKKICEMTAKLRKWEQEKEEKERKLSELEGKIREFTEKIEEIEDLDRETNDLIEQTAGKKAKLAPKIRESRKEKGKQQLIVSKTESKMEEMKGKYAEKVKIFEEICKNLDEAKLQKAGIRQRARERGFPQYLMEMVDNVPISEFITPEHSYSQVIHDLESLHSSLQTGLSSPVPLTPLELYNSSVEALLGAKARLSDLYASLGQRRSEYERLRVERRNRFGEGFCKILQEFKRFYKLLLGEMADADIEFVDIADPFSSGLRISARPPSKSWKLMKVLSGGERTLVSLSLILAFHEYRPNAIYLLDEIDAALDFVNVQKVAELIRRKALEAQFLVVSLHVSLYERSDQLIGVYKPEAAGNLASPTRAVVFTPPSSSVLAKNS